MTIKQRYWGNALVKDAKVCMRIYVSEENAHDGVAGCSQYCASALAAVDIPGVLDARIFRQYAYLKFKGKNGLVHAERFSIREGERSKTAAFDAGDREIMAGDEFLLSPPTACQKLDAMVMRHKAQNKRVINGIVKHRTGSSQKHGTRASGTGLVHFTVYREIPA